MNEIPKKPVTVGTKLMEPQEISEAFSQLGLQKDEDREKFRSLAEVRPPENESFRILLSGTTATLKDAQGGSYA